MLRRILQNLMANAVQYTQARRHHARGAPPRLGRAHRGVGYGPRHPAGASASRSSRSSSAGRPRTGRPSAASASASRSCSACRRRSAIPWGCARASATGRASPSRRPFAGTVALRRGSAGRRRPIVAPYGLTGVKVVVIDNDDSVLEAMQSLLEHWACEVTLVRGLRRARPSHRKRRSAPIILLVDYHLDGGTCGLTAVDRLRAAAGRRLPAIVITADHSAADRRPRARRRTARSS